jgi:hypothetical protein
MAGVEPAQVKMPARNQTAERKHSQIPRYHVYEPQPDRPPLSQLAHPWHLMRLPFHPYPNSVFDAARADWPSEM